MIKRQDILKYTIANPVCIELGVAEGVFSEMILQSYPVKHLYSVDMWAGDSGHDDRQHERACKRLNAYSDRNTIMKMKFEQALEHFPNSFFDFIYIDGYAHTGQDNGKTLDDWWPKLKLGGVFSGDDYCKKSWPRTVSVVDNFCKNHNLDLNIHTFQNEDNNPWCMHPSWYVLKKDIK